eukprot:TRINITY_DN18802_c0_g1::TRINITY_DN18802_c0_g1_i1::g.15235::m.15235 TRINITY_DN18802_c0_g1::TRINITY_DN18802_c0_g1_i1::g.15235  ORF type:complete len:338 (+),score=96.17,sp/Q5R5Z5/ARPC2_PONAB/38.68/4e-62,P34-Arc/PF04045.9/2.7e-64 TRINITY_DN18802_c0_g1_i1:67-1014(+)
MILLEAEHQVVRETLDRVLSSAATDKREVADVEAADFDGVLYHVHVNPEDKDTTTISMYLPCLEELKLLLGAELLTSYQDLVTTPESKYNLAFKFSLSALPGDKDEVVNKFARLKRNLVGAPLDIAFSAIMEGKKPSRDYYKLNYRGDDSETLYVIPGDERVTVIYRVAFQDSTDIEIARVFMEEFACARRDPALKNVPAVSFSEDAPLEVKNIPGYDESKDKPAKDGKEKSRHGYVSFVIFKSHVANAEKKARAVDVMFSFRSYLHYHIKCAKAYFHSRMRNRTEELLKVLRRAIPEKENKQKKTMSGRTFTQK